MIYYVLHKGALKHETTKISLLVYTGDNISKYISKFNS